MRAPAAVLSTVVLFWAGILLAGVLSEGYTLQDNYMSSLAARGSDVAPLAILALCVLTFAHALAAWFVRGFSPLTTVFLTASALAFGCVAGYRALCSEGAAGCHASAPASRDGSTVVDELTKLHGLAALEYALFMLAAMVVFAVVAFRRRIPWAGVATLALALGGYRLFAREGDYLGVQQRLWLLANTVWLVLAVAVSARAAATPRRAVAR